MLYPSHPNNTVTALQWELAADHDDPVHTRLSATHDADRQQSASFPRTCLSAGQPVDRDKVSFSTFHEAETVSKNTVTQGGQLWNMTVY
jgi:hypothetical protein